MLRHHSMCAHLRRLLQSPADDACPIFRVAGVPLRHPLIAEMAYGDALGRDCPPARRIASGDDLIRFIRGIVGNRFEHRLVLGHSFRGEIAEISVTRYYVRPGRSPVRNLCSESSKRRVFSISYMVWLPHAAVLSSTTAALASQDFLAGNEINPRPQIGTKISPKQGCKLAWQCRNRGRVFSIFPLIHG